MIERIRLQNFKASRDVDLRLAPLTVLTGLNSSGKSTLLQAVGLLRQSYENRERITTVSLSGFLVQLGQFRDVLSEDAVEDSTGITMHENGQKFEWRFRGGVLDYKVHLIQYPESPPDFVWSPDFQFLQADRLVPKTMYPQTALTGRNSRFLGVHGEYTVDFLAKHANQPVPSRRAYGGLFPGVNADLLSKVAPTSGLSDQTSRWLQLLSPGARITASDLEGTDEVLLRFNYLGKALDSRSNAYRPTNVGFGLTYSLPIIVSCLSSRTGSLLLFENPEAHLHPRGQAAIGALIAQCATEGIQVLVETHSDHVLNSIRLAVRGGRLQGSDLVVHYFTRRPETGDVFVQSPVVLEDGRMSNWPDGFFDQWDKDIDALLG